MGNTIYGTCYDLEGKATARYQFYAEVKTAQQNVDANSSTLTVALKVRRNPDYAYAASAYNLTDAVTVSLSVDGVEVYRTAKADIDTRNAKTWVFTTQTVEAQHNADGTKTVRIGASFSGAGVSSLDSGTLEGEVELEAIPRSSSILSVGAVTLGQACNVKWLPESADFRYRLRFSLGAWSAETDVIHPNRTTAYLYTGYILPLEVAEEIQGTASAAMTVALYTYSDQEGTVQVGTVERASFTVSVPGNSDTAPAVSMRVEAVQQLPEAFAGLYIQGKSKVRATVTAQAKLGAAIEKTWLRVEGKVYGEDVGLTSDYLSNGGKVYVDGFAQDDRGIQNGVRNMITVIPYSKPKILPASTEVDVIAQRCDAEGNVSDVGTYLQIKASRSYSAVEAGGIQKNFCQIRYRYMVSTGSWSAWETILAGEDLESDEIVTAPLLGGSLQTKDSYLVQVQAIDDVGESAVTTITVPTETVHTHRTKNGIGFGKHVDGENLLDVGWDAHFHGQVKIGDVTLKDYILQIISEGA